MSRLARQYLDAAKPEVRAVCEYAKAFNTVLARRAGWGYERIGALQRGEGVGDERLDSLLAAPREAAARQGSVYDSTWNNALDASWTDEELAEAFVHLGVTVYVAHLLHYADTELHVPSDHARTQPNIRIDSKGTRKC